MRKATLASMLILCGSTAALANAGTDSAPQVRNSTGNAMMNEMAPDTMVANDTGTTTTTTTNTTDDMPVNTATPMPSPTPRSGSTPR